MVNIKDWWASRLEAAAIKDDRPERERKLPLFSIIFDAVAAGYFASSALYQLVYTFEDRWGWAIYDGVFALLFIALLIWSVRIFRRHEALHVSIAESEGAILAFDAINDEIKRRGGEGKVTPVYEPEYREQSVQDA